LVVAAAVAYVRDHPQIDTIEIEQIPGRQPQGHESWRLIVPKAPKGEMRPAEVFGNSKDRASECEAMSNSGAGRGQEKAPLGLICP
jgi:hypothetical protein